MSETKGAKKTEKPGFFTRAKNWIVALPGRISGAFKNMVAELKKVAWPSKKDLINYSIVVIAFVVVLAIVVCWIPVPRSWSRSSSSCKT